MRVLILTALFPPEPVVSSMMSKDLYEELKKRGHEVRVFCPRPSRPLGFRHGTRKTDSNVITSKSYVAYGGGVLRRFLESFSFGWSSGLFILKKYKDFDIIYQNSWPLFGQGLAVIAARLKGVPIVTHIQDVYPESLQGKMPLWRGLRFLDRFIVRNSKGIIVNNDIVNKYIVDSRRTQDEKVVTVSNWQDENSFQPYFPLKVGTETKTKTLMYLGNIGPLANLNMVISSFIKAEVKDWKLVVAGQGTEREELFNRFAASNNVSFIDVAEGQVHLVQSSADLMLLPQKAGTGNNSLPSKLSAYCLSGRGVFAVCDYDSLVAVNILKYDFGMVCSEPRNLIQAFKSLESLSNEEIILMSRNSYKFGSEHLSKKSNLNNLINGIIGSS
tara:strand:+ start:13891 stop:15048 length:1158 start_codon:yes stop_codon:yes gene_type:complete